MHIIYRYMYITNYNKMLDDNAMIYPVLGGMVLKPFPQGFLYPSIILGFPHRDG